MMVFGHMMAGRCSFMKHMQSEKVIKKIKKKNLKMKEQRTKHTGTVQLTPII